MPPCRSPLLRPNLCTPSMVRFIRSRDIHLPRRSVEMKVETKSKTVRSCLLFGGVCVLTLCVLIAVNANPYALLALVPLVVAAFFVYRSYQLNVETAAAQAAQAALHLREMRRSEERFRIAFNYTAVGMAIVETSGRWVQVNASLCRLLGYPEDEMLATDFQSLTHPDDLHGVLAAIEQLTRGDAQTCEVEMRYLHEDGHEVWTLASVALAHTTSDIDAGATARSHAGAPRSSDVDHLIFQIQDITDRKRAEERLVHDAFHDALTGLPNRALFMDHLGLSIARHRRQPERQFAVLFLDVDRFKIINDSLGHMIGDDLLIAISRRLEQCLRPGDTVARLGGDEFTVLLEDLPDADEALRVAERIKRELAVPFSLRGHEIFCGASIGIAPGSAGYEHPEDALRDADTAMYHAKSHGSARYSVFDRRMHTQATNLLQLENDLRHAIERKEISLYYQPIMRLDSHKLSGFEALLRWQHPQHGFISPAEFIPIAEDTSLIVPIGSWVLREACIQMRRWQNESDENSDLVMSVNLSGKQFAQVDLIAEIKNLLEETGLQPRCLKLEITESVVMDNIETAVETLEDMRRLGIALSIDDFGTGYSSLSYLHRFPLSTLKIDRSFVSLMLGNNENSEIVRTIVMLAEKLNMDVVAEGIESDDQLALLRQIGCQYGQGYLFSRPLPSEQASAFLRNTATARSSDINLKPAKAKREVHVAA